MAWDAPADDERAGVLRVGDRVVFNRPEQIPHLHPGTSTFNPRTRFFQEKSFFVREQVFFLLKSARRFRGFLPLKYFQMVYAQKVRNASWKGLKSCCVEVLSDFC